MFCNLELINGRSLGMKHFDYRSLKNFYIRSDYHGDQWDHYYWAIVQIEFIY